jgi:hypothetical protein
LDRSHSGVPGGDTVPQAVGLKIQRSAASRVRRCGIGGSPGFGLADSGLLGGHGLSDDHTGGAGTQRLAEIADASLSLLLGGFPEKASERTGQAAIVASGSVPWHIHNVTHFVFPLPQGHRGGGSCCVLINRRQKPIDLGERRFVAGNPIAGVFNERPGVSHGPFRLPNGGVCRVQSMCQDMGNNATAACQKGNLFIPAGNGGFACRISGGQRGGCFGEFRTGSGEFRSGLGTPCGQSFGGHFRSSPSLQVSYANH